MPREARPPLFSLRVAPPRMVRRLLGAATVALLVLLWWLATGGGAPEDRLISPVILPSPGEVIASFPSLLNERALLQSIAATLKRVLIGFGLAILVGVPLGIVAGSWRVVEASGAPLALFGRNLPVAALIPLTILWFGIDESAEGHVHLHRLRALRVFGRRPRDCRRPRPLRRDRADAGRLAPADRVEGSRGARAAGHLRQPAAPVRHGVRVHHAGRADQRGARPRLSC